MTPPGFAPTAPPQPDPEVGGGGLRGFLGSFNAEGIYTSAPGMLRQRVVNF